MHQNMLFSCTNIVYMSIDHVCKTPGCNSGLILDGNMKNARQVCMVKDAGQLQFSEIPGTIAVG